MGGTAELQELSGGWTEREYDVMVETLRVGKGKGVKGSQTGQKGKGKGEGPKLRDGYLDDDEIRGLRKQFNSGGKSARPSGKGGKDSLPMRGNKGRGRGGVEGEARDFGKGGRGAYPF